MNIRKPLITGLLVVGCAAGGAGVASAFDGDGEREPDGADAQGVAAQVDGTGEPADQDGDGDGERDGRRGRRGLNRETVAETIGITVEDLRAGLQDGTSIAEIASANGVAADAVIDALIADVEERLDAKVADGDLTEEEAAEKLESKTERITDRVNGVDDADEDEADGEG